MTAPHRLLAPGFDWDNLETQTWEEFVERDLLFLQLMGIDPDLYYVDLHEPLTFMDTLLPEDFETPDIGFVKIATDWYRLKVRQ